MNPKAKQLLEKANEAKYLHAAGEINYEQMQQACTEYVNFANQRVSELAKEHGMRPKFISVKGFMR